MVKDELNKITALWPGMTDFERAILRDLTERSGASAISDKVSITKAPRHAFAGQIRTFAGAPMIVFNILLVALLIIGATAYKRRDRKRKLEVRLAKLTAH